MPESKPTKEDVLIALRECAQALGRTPSKQDFRRHTGITEYWVMQHFESWREAQRAAGVEPHTGNIKLDDTVLLEDWGRVAREDREIPTRERYRRTGKFSPCVFERHFGPWSGLPAKFRDHAKDKLEWAEVLALLPQSGLHRRSVPSREASGDGASTAFSPGGQ